MNRAFQLYLIFILSVAVRLVAPWYYNCFDSTGSESALLSDSCSLRNIVVRSDIDAQNVYFPPTNINFFQSNFSSFSPTLGRRLPDEAERVSFYNCVVPKLAIPTKLRGLRLVFSNVATIFSNYLTENAMEELVVVGAQITSMKFVEVFRNLRYLRIEANPIQIVTMDTFRNLTKVEVIKLSGNRIFFLEPSTKPLELLELVELDLQRNFLIQLDSSLWYSPNMKILTLHLNFLKSLNLEQLHQSFPQLQWVTLGRNLWNCQRLRVILGSMFIRNISTNIEDSSPGCQTYSFVEYVSLSGLDSISKAKLMVERMEEVSTGNYAELSNTTLLEDLQGRSDELARKLQSLNNTVERIQTSYADVKLWIERKANPTH